MPVVAMFGSLFVTTGQSTGLCCGKSRRGNKNREGGTIHGQQINIKHKQPESSHKIYQAVGHESLETSPCGI